MTTTDTDAGLSLDAKFSLVVDALGAHTAELRRRRLALSARMQPVHRVYPQVVTIPASGLAVAWYGGPDQGHEWFVREIIVGGVTPATVVAGRADVFVSATDYRLVASLAAMGTQDWRDQFTTLPGRQFYSENLHLRAPEDLFVVFSAATVAQQYIAVAAVEDIQEGISAPEYAE